MEKKTSNEHEAEQASWTAVYIYAAVGIIVTLGILVAIFSREPAHPEEGLHQEAPEAETPREATAAQEPTAPEADAVETPPPPEPQAADVLEPPDGLTIEGMPPVPARLSDVLGEPLPAMPARICGWNPQGGLLVLMSTGGGMQIHHIKAPGEAPVALTSGDGVSTCTVVSGGPDAGAILFTRTDQDGNGRIFRLGLDGGAETMLTSEGSSGSIAVDPATGLMAYSSDVRMAGTTDVRLMDPADPSTDRVVLEAPSDAAYLPVAWMPSGKHLLVHEVVDDDDVKTLLVDTETGTARTLDLDETQSCQTRLLTASPEKGATLGLSDCVKGDHTNLVTVEMKIRYGKPLTRDIPWDVVALEASADGTMVAFVVDQGGESKLYTLVWQDEKWRRKTMDVLPAGLVESMAMAPGGEQLAVALSTFVSPGSVLVVDLASGDVKTWFTGGPGGGAPGVAESFISYPTFDLVSEAPRQIASVQLMPTGEAKGPLPVVILLGGGKDGRWTAGYQPMVGPLAARLVTRMNMAVLAPNVREAEGEKSWDAVRDVGALLDWIREQPELDAERVLVAGIPRGGELTLASLEEYSPKLKGGILGPAVPGLQPSPGARIADVQDPVLIIRAAEDPLLTSQTVGQMASALGERDVACWQVTGPDMGSSFAEPSTQSFIAAAVVLFVEDLLGLGPETGVQEE